jgi:hypothetical protein
VSSLFSPPFCWRKICGIDFDEFVLFHKKKPRVNVCIAK